MGLVLGNAGGGGISCVLLLGKNDVKQHTTISGISFRTFFLQKYIRYIKYIRSLAIGETFKRCLRIFLSVSVNLYFLKNEGVHFVLVEHKTFKMAFRGLIWGSYPDSSLAADRKTSLDAGRDECGVSSCIVHLDCICHAGCLLPFWRS